MIPSATRRKKGFPSILCNATADIMTKTFFQTKKEGEADSLQTSLQWTFVTGVRLLVTNLTDRHIYIDPQADIVGSHPHLTSATLIYGSIPASECDVIPMAFIQVFLCSSLCVSPYNPPWLCFFLCLCVAVHRSSEQMRSYDWPNRHWRLLWSCSQCMCGFHCKGNWSSWAYLSFRDVVMHVSIWRGKQRENHLKIITTLQQTCLVTHTMKTLFNCLAISCTCILLAKNQT